MAVNISHLDHSVSVPASGVKVGRHRSKAHGQSRKLLDGHSSKSIEEGNSFLDKAQKENKGYACSCATEDFSFLWHMYVKLQLQP